MKYLVTGGAGFIGSHIATALVERGDTVRVLDNLCTRHAGQPGAHRRQGRVRRGRRARRQAGREGGRGRRRRVSPGGAGLGAAEPREAARHARRLRHRHAATCSTRPAAAACGASCTPAPAAPTATSRSCRSARATCPRRCRPTRRPSWPARSYCQSFAASFGLETVVIRYFNVFGPRQDPNGEYSAVIPKFVVAMLAGKRPTIFGDGLQSRDFTYVENVVQRQPGRRRAPAAAGRVFNVACGRQYNLLELIAAINRVLGTKIEPIFAPGPRRRRARQPGRHHRRPRDARLRADDRLRRRPAAVDRLLQVAGVGRFHHDDTTVTTRIRSTHKDSSAGRRRGLRRRCPNHPQPNASDFCSSSRRAKRPACS